VLDSQHLLNIGTAIDARPADGFGDAKIREL
jgi:hypothetical protein